jgi:hypothetical protein
VRTWTAESSAPPERAWELLAQPGRWHEWAPHVRGALGLGSPEVRDGARGVVRLAGVVPVPARIVHKRPGRAWSWRVGPAVMTHRVEARDAGHCEVAVDLVAPGPIEPLLAATYGPVIGVMVRRLARVAERWR